MNKFEQALAIKFLKSKRILTTFKKGMEGYHNISFEKRNKDLDYKDLIIGAFIWHEQPEGSKHWINIEKEYLKFMEEELSKVKTRESEIV